jgi:hypothetical protein
MYVGGRSNGSAFTSRFYVLVIRLLHWQNDNCLITSEFIVTPVIVYYPVMDPYIIVIM